MLTKLSQATERRTHTRATIDQMLAERHQVLVLLCQVSGLEPFRVEESVTSKFEEFRVILVDYIATAHFGLYERIAEGNERRREAVRLAARLYPRIEESTQSVLDFTEKYEVLSPSHLSSLQADLSRLGELLAARIDDEDKLIEAVLGETISDSVQGMVIH